MVFTSGRRSRGELRKLRKLRGSLQWQAMTLSCRRWWLKWKNNCPSFVDSLIHLDWCARKRDLPRPCCSAMPTQGPCDLSCGRCGFLLWPRNEKWVQQLVQILDPLTNNNKHPWNLAAAFASSCQEYWFAHPQLWTAHQEAAGQCQGTYGHQFDGATGRFLWLEEWKVSQPHVGHRFSASRWLPRFWHDCDPSMIRGGFNDCRRYLEKKSHV